jgi:tetratricopeptide (TPR) repeat protein
MILRVVAGVLIAGGLVVLGAVQLASSAVYGDLAARPSLPAALHPAATALIRWIPGQHARAQAALHDGDLDDAQRRIAALPSDPAADDLRGRLADARGDTQGAVADFVRAGDAVRAQAIIDALQTTDLDDATRLEKALASRLSRDAAASEVTGQAYWRYGQLIAANPRAPGYLAEDMYERALVYAPNEETYLLAAGYQSLVVQKYAQSLELYTRAAAVVPNSADAYAGLAWSSAALGDCTAARASLAKSRALRTVAVADPADDPRVGLALHRCLQ